MGGRMVAAGSNLWASTVTPFQRVTVAALVRTRASRGFADPHPHLDRREGFARKEDPLGKYLGAKNLVNFC